MVDSIEIALLFIYITREYKIEIRLIRLANQKSIFSLKPNTYALGDRFNDLNLVNIGQTLTHIDLDCKNDMRLKNLYSLINS